MKQRFRQRKSTYLQPLKAVSGRALKGVEDKKGAVNFSLFSNFNDFLPSDLKGQVELIRVKWPRNNGSDIPPSIQSDTPIEFATLYVRVQHSAMAFLCTQKTPEILSRVNSFFGFKLAAHIKIKTEPLKQNKQHKPNNLSLSPEESARNIPTLDDTIEDDGLKASLKKLQILREKRIKMKN